MTRRTRRRSATFFAAFISVAMVAAACTPPPPPTVKTWEFKSTQVTVDEANDCVPDIIFGGCVIFTDDTDEAYVLNVAFRVKIGQANSASTWGPAAAATPPRSPRATARTCRDRPRTQPPGLGLAEHEIEGLRDELVTFNP